MAITYIEVDTTQLNVDIRELEENTVKAKNSLENLMAEITEMNTMWKGKAHQAFNKQVNVDYEYMKDLLNEIDKLTGCMKNANNEYVKCENAVRASVNSIRV